VTVIVQEKSGSSVAYPFAFAYPEPQRHSILYALFERCYPNGAVLDSLRAEKPNFHNREWRTRRLAMHHMNKSIATLCITRHAIAAGRQPA